VQVCPLAGLCAFDALMQLALAAGFRPAVSIDLAEALAAAMSQRCAAIRPYDPAVADARRGELAAEVYHAFRSIHDMPELCRRYGISSTAAFKAVAQTARTLRASPTPNRSIHEITP
jgi:hypothetical protein